MSDMNITIKGAKRLLTAGKYCDKNIVVTAEGGGAGDFNIAYGDTAPEDTTKLWVKTAEPEAVQVAAQVAAANEEMEAGVSSLPNLAYGMAAVVVDKKVYLFGGVNSTSYDTINVFDTETNTISTLDTKLPQATYGMAAVVVDKKVYLFGGVGSSNTTINTINVFDTETNTISTLSQTVPSRHNMAAAVVDKKVYLFGGMYIYNSWSYYDTISVFDTETNTVTTLSQKLPSKAGNIASAVIGTKVYLFGGSQQSSGFLDTINVFDTETNTISTLDTTIPTAADGIASAVIGTKVYLFGGYYWNSGNFYYDTINVFDTETNTISTLDTTIPTAAYLMASAVVGANVYLFGGRGASNVRLGAINRFSVSFALAQNTLLIEASLTENILNLLSSVEIGVKNVYKGNADGVGEMVAAALYKDGAWTEI